MLRRRKKAARADPDPDPDLAELRAADAEYHGVCIDVQEPILPVEALRLDELAAAVERLSRAIAQIRERVR